MADRLLICGSRAWTDAAPIEQQIRLTMPEVVIQGEARGADRIARDFARSLGIPTLDFRALWDLYGKRAGPIRNEQMLREGRPSCVVAFTDNFRNRRSGTRHMCRIAWEAGRPVTVVEHGIGGCYSWDVEAEDFRA